MDYLRWVPQFARQCFYRVDFVCGGIIAVAYFLLADQVGIGDGHPLRVASLIVAASFAWASYAAYREERALRDVRERALRIEAKLGALAINSPDPGPTKSSISVHVSWEIWVNQDVATDRFGLNLIYAYDKPWWQSWWLWKKTKFPQVGIPNKGHGSTQHREWIRADEEMPRRGDGVFEFVGSRYEKGDPHWLLELVLVTGVPNNVYRVPISLLDIVERDRRSHPPL